MSLLNLVLDLLLVVLFIVCIVVCTKRGLIKSLFKSLRVFVSFLLAALLNNAVGGFIKDVWVKGAVHQWVHDMASPQVEETGAAAESLVSSIPPVIKTVLQYFGFSIDKRCPVFKEPTFKLISVTGRFCRHSKILSYRVGNRCDKTSAVRIKTNFIFLTIVWI